MKKVMSRVFAAMMMLMVCMALAAPVYATEKEETTNTEAAVNEGTEAVTIEAADNSTGAKAIGAALAVGIAAAAGAIGMGIAIGKSVEGISRQPEAEGKIRTSLMLGLVFIETAIIYALIVGILIIFVL